MTEERIEKDENLFKRYAAADNVGSVRECALLYLLSLKSDVSSLFFVLKLSLLGSEHVYDNKYGHLFDNSENKNNNGVNNDDTKVSSTEPRGALNCSFLFLRRRMIFLLSEYGIALRNPLFVSFGVDIVLEDVPADVARSSFLDIMKEIKKTDNDERFGNFVHHHHHHPEDNMNNNSEYDDVFRLRFFLYQELCFCNDDFVRSRLIRLYSRLFSKSSMSILHAKRQRKKQVRENRLSFFLFFFLSLSLTLCYFFFYIFYFALLLCIN